MQRTACVWNLKKLLYEAKLNKLKKTQISLYQTYSKPKWQWDMTSNYKKSQELTGYVSKIDKDIKSQIIVKKNEAIILNPDGSLWNKIKEIKASETYKTFLKIDVTKSFNDSANSGVTVAVTKPAVKMTGDQKLRRLRLVLDSFPITRGEIQIMFHEKFIQSCLPIIYRGEWDYNFDAIMRRNRLVEIFLERVLICPRRFGKSVGVALFGAACLWTIPNHTITIFSRGKRMAQKLMLQCLRFALSLPDFKRYIVSCTTEKVELCFGSDDRRCLCCLPGSTEVLFFFS